MQIWKEKETKFHAESQAQPTDEAGGLIVSKIGSCVNVTRRYLTAKAVERRLRWEQVAIPGPYGYVPSGKKKLGKFGGPEYQKVSDPVHCLTHNSCRSTPELS